jgi:hypothetical protein
MAKMLTACITLFHALYIYHYSHAQDFADENGMAFAKDGTNC